jgi:hypothetical protein
MMTGDATIQGPHCLVTSWRSLRAGRTLHFIVPFPSWTRSHIIGQLNLQGGQIGFRFHNLGSNAMEVIFRLISETNLLGSDDSATVVVDVLRHSLLHRRRSTTR